MDKLPESRVYFRNLDVLRFLAAFAIVIFHGQTAFAHWIGFPNVLRQSPDMRLIPNQTGQELMRVVENLTLGVEFFFLISGFLITYLMLYEKQQTGQLALGKFYLRRILRIWPLFYLILLTAPLWTSLGHSAEPDYLWNALFLSNYKTIFTNTYDPALSHYWSICVEEHFYLVWPVLLYIVPVKRLPWLFGGIILVAVGFRFYAHANLPEHYIHANLNTLSRMDTLAFGSWIGWMAINKPFTIRIHRAVRIVVYIAFAGLILFDNINVYSNVFSFVFKRNLYTLFFAFMLVNYLYNPDAFFNFRKKNILHYFGKVSYGMYMYHNILFGVLFDRVILRYQIGEAKYFWPVYLLSVFAITILSYELFEKHILKLKSRFAVIQTDR